MRAASRGALKPRVKELLRWMPWVFNANWDSLVQIGLAAVISEDSTTADWKLRINKALGEVLSVQEWFNSEKI